MTERNELMRSALRRVEAAVNTAFHGQTEDDAECARVLETGVASVRNTLADLDMKLNNLPPCGGENKKGTK